MGKISYVLTLCKPPVGLKMDKIAKLEHMLKVDNSKPDKVARDNTLGHAKLR